MRFGKSDSYETSEDREPPHKIPANREEPGSVADKGKGKEREKSSRRAVVRSDPVSVP